MKQIKKVRIEGNGCQAPYGIGEIIDIIPASHYRKIANICNKYYNAPTLRDDATGERLELDWTYDNYTERESLIGFKPAPLF
jgi:hypothetical protein